MKYFDKIYCCCCRVRPKRADWLRIEAKKKYNTETDLLEIVKKMRVFQFMSTQMIKPHQRDLINFFDDYTIKGKDPAEKNN